MPGVLNLTDVFQLIVDSLDERALPQESFVPEADQTILHVLADFGQYFEPLAQEEVMKSLGNIALVAKELPLKACGESLDRLAVVDIARRQSKSQQFALIVDHKVQFEAIEPSHGGLASPGKALKDCMGRDTVVITDGEGRRVDEGTPGATAFAGGERAAQGDEGAGDQLDKALIAHQLGEIRGAGARRHTP
jgi:hypothetical protein